MKSILWRKVIIQFYSQDDKLQFGRYQAPNIGAVRIKTLPYSQALTRQGLNVTARRKSCHSKKPFDSLGRSPPQSAKV